MRNFIKISYCGNGSQLRGGASLQKDSTLVINGGTFTTHVFGGCGASNSENGKKTLVSGNSGVVVDSSNNTISFDGNIYAGSIGYGNISGGTSMTFKGLGSNLTFATDSYVMGGSQMFMGTVEYVGGNKVLSFTDFTGEFGASIKNGFTHVVINDSNVSLTSDKNVLNGISSWSIEVASSEAELTLGNGRNSFAGDTLTLTIEDGASPSSGVWDVITGTNATLTGWDNFSSVSIGGKAAAFADGAWCTDTYRLYRAENTIKLASY